MTLDNILEEIKNAETILVLSHENPDGDAIGSSLAMVAALKEMGKNPDIILHEIATTFDFLPGRDKIKETTDIENYDLVISLDCASLNRLIGKEYFENAKKTIVIDHHGSNNMYGDINFVNPASPSCCEVLVGILKYLNIKIDKKIGTCLLTGVITDTGGFKYHGVSVETFSFVEEMLQIGVRLQEICKRVLDTKTKAYFKLMKKVIDRMEFLEDGKVTFSYINNSDLEEVNAGIGDHEGLVNIGRDIEDVEVSVFLRQKEDEENIYKVSMRSNSYVDVSNICILFNGGGHDRASGAVIEGDINSIKEKILKEIRKVL